jgi:hypothetical protein
VLTNRDRQRLAATFATVVMAAMATVTAVALGPGAAAVATQSHPCPLHLHDYGSVLEWQLACVDHFAHGGGGDGDGDVCAMDPNPWAIPITCVDESYGWWSNQIACYLRPMDPQPAADDPAWAGHEPADGVIYQLTCPWLEGVDGLPYWEWAFPRFFPAGHGTLGQLVQQAIAQLVVTGPDIAMAPDPAGVGLVGLPVWMWTRVDEHTWSPEPVRLSASGWTVVVEATVDRIVWDMGNGEVVVCDQGPGTPYRDDFGGELSPDCGFAGYDRPSLTRPDGVYQVTATTHWLLRWRFEGTAVTGTESVQRTSATSVRINELQVVTA